MPKRMLIDATHPEETRVVIADGNELLEYDYETSTKRQIKSNIYLAKLTRVEPSLQAAFVDFGGNRHGFLAFNEIHPDYYRIPIEDREKLLAESGDDEGGEENGDAESVEGEQLEVVGDSRDEDIHQLGDAHRRRLRKLTRTYKIQEVIKRRQILLVQVVKEERGTKGAALTTYLSLPGRYCVLMPNTSRGGGISRKITDAKHRKSMRETLTALDAPEGMAVIMRTAGVSRTKAEIKRDYEYLRRLWDDIRKLTLDSTAPALIYEEGDVVKRSLRDLYDRDIDEILVEGDEAYKSAKALMRNMIPSHARRVQKYEDSEIPLLNRYQIDQQLDEIHEPVVQLRSGGYIVINTTEALVAIDVNSGRSTRERNIEQTAYRTNMEAANEIARQLRLRDLAGLIVIDFIDMTVSRNNHAVERRLKEAMKSDRARIQIGRISPFGLLELSRQRLRPSLLEAHTQMCPVCGGAGVMRSTESTSMSVLRELEEEGMRKRAKEVTVTAQTEVALYLLNQKRNALRDIEERYGFKVLVLANNTLASSDYEIGHTRHDGDEGAVSKKDEASGEEAPKRRQRRGRRRADEEADSAEGNAAEEAEDPGETGDGDEDDAPKRAGRRRSRRGRRRAGEEGDSAEGNAAEEAEDPGEPGDGDEDDAPKRAARRRSRRGGRRRRKAESEENGEKDAEAAARDSGNAEKAEGDGEEAGRNRRPRARARRAADAPGEAPADGAPDAAADGDAGEAPESGSGAEIDAEIDIPEPTPETERGPAAQADDSPAEPNGGDPDETGDGDGTDAPRTRGGSARRDEPEAQEGADGAGAQPPDDDDGDADRPRRSGWWNRATP